MGCPSCGAEISYDQRLAVLTVCEYCNTAVIFDEKAASIAGKMSVLAQPAGPLFVGASGKLKDGLSFSVIGRVRYGYEQGFWDEWYLQHEDMSTSWLTEDEKRFMHEQPVKLEVDSQVILSLNPGQNIDLNDTKFSVREKGIAICEGGEGQLPFRIISDEQLPFLDLRAADGTTATIEIEPNGVVKFFQGQPLEFTDIQVDNENLKQPDMSIERAASGSSRERITFDPSRIQAVQCIHCGGTNNKVDFSSEHINCSHCNQSLEMPATATKCPSCAAQVQTYTPDAQSVCCQYCGCSVSLSSGEPTLLRKLKKDDQIRKKKFKLPLALGEKATFDNLEFTLVGYIRFKEVDDGVYISNEYLLYNRDWGYRWLVSYEGHWTLEEKLTKIPQNDPQKLQYSSYRKSFSAAGKNWKFFETGKGHIDWVEGELPWVAKINDKSKYIESIAPPYMLVCEITENEVEWSQYKYLEVSELAAAFKKDESKFRRPLGIGACQVNKNKSYHLTAGLLAIIFAVIGLIGFFAASSGSKEVAKFTIKSNQYKEETFSPSFELGTDNTIYRADFYSPVNNSWVYLDLALVNDKEEALLDFSSQISYYHGYDDGSWSEGSKDDSVYFLANKGTYKFLLKGSAGHGNTAVDVTKGKPVTIRIHEDVKVVLYFIIFAIFAFIIGISFLLRPAFFEGRRWKHTVETD